MTQVTRELIELAERVEKAEGADAELDLAIARHMGVTVLKRNYEDTANYETTHWHYTASIDAAMSLVPEGWFWDVGGYLDGSGNASVQSPDYNEDTFNGISVWLEAKTPALALVSAALRARSAATL